MSIRGRVLTLEGAPECKVLFVNELIADGEGITTDEQRLILAGIEIDDALTGALLFNTLTYRSHISLTLTTDYNIRGGFGRAPHPTTQVSLSADSFDGELN